MYLSLVIPSNKLRIGSEYSYYVLKRGTAPGSRVALTIPALKSFDNTVIVLMVDNVMTWSFF